MLGLILLSVTVQKPTIVYKAGDYRVEIWVKEGEETLYLKDSRGRVVTSLKDRMTRLRGLHTPDAKNAYRDHNGDGVKEIVFETWTGGAHGSNTYHVWSLGKTPKCLLSYDKNNISDTDDFAFRDLDGDGIAEIASWYDGFGYLLDAGAYAASLPVVFKFDKGLYRLRTADFPGEFASYETEFLSYLKDPEARMRRIGAVGMLALATMRNTRTSTLKTLRGMLSIAEYAARKREAPWIEKITLGVSDRVSYPAAYSRGAMIDLS